VLGEPRRVMPAACLEWGLAIVIHASLIESAAHAAPMSRCEVGHELLLSWPSAARRWQSTVFPSLPRCLPHCLAHVEVPETNAILTSAAPAFTWPILSSFDLHMLATSPLPHMKISTSAGLLMHLPGTHNADRPLRSIPVVFVVFVPLAAPYLTVPLASNVTRSSLSQLSTLLRRGPGS
jgi:hypothetical protein